MQTIRLETRIAAPVERCFLLSLSIDLHIASTVQTQERAIAGVTHGSIGLNETVTWRGRHFGIMLTQQTRITRYEKPRYFQDIMIKGFFRSFEHDHFFDLLEAGGTLMRDELRFTAPLGAVGRIVESLVLRSYLNSFLAQRNELIKTVAESPTEEWRKFVPAAT